MHLTSTVRGIERSGALQARVREIGERLHRCDARITQCHITVIGDGRAPVAVKIHVSIPGAQVHADGERGSGAADDVFMALRHAYESARRQLRDLQREGRSSSLLSASRGSTDR